MDVEKVKRWCKRPPVFVAIQRACKPNMAARNRWLASYNAIVSLEALCKVCSRLMLSKQNSAYAVPHLYSIKRYLQEESIIAHYNFQENIHYVNQ
jgi:hypothetical protein